MMPKTDRRKLYFLRVIDENEGRHKNEILAYCPSFPLKEMSDEALIVPIHENIYLNDAGREKLRSLSQQELNEIQKDINFNQLKINKIIAFATLIAAVIPLLYILTKIQELTSWIKESFFNMVAQLALFLGVISLLVIVGVLIWKLSKQVKQDWDI